MVFNLHTCETLSPVILLPSVARRGAVLKHNRLVERTLRHGDQRLSIAQTHTGGKKELRRLSNMQEKCFDTQTAVRLHDRELNLACSSFAT
jgi:hypothetical protein